jgi:DnaJ-class molecular chaperone
LNASDKDIRSAWKKLTLKHHPDKFHTEHEKKANGEKIKEINAAYEVLNDPTKKNKYDQYGDDWLNNKVPDFADMGGFDSMFGNIFGGSGKHQKRENVQPIQEILNVSLYDLFFGKLVEKEIIRNVLCKLCEGTGSADKKLAKCTTCKGNGVVIQVVSMGPGMISQTQSPCHVCRGTGKGVSSVNKCNTCNGNPSCKKKAIIKVQIEPGMYNKKVIVLENIGNEYVNNSGKIAIGPVMIVLQEEEHPVFKREFAIGNKKNNADLLMIIDINFVESFCGFSKEIKYIDNSLLYICETNIIKDGEIKKIPNKGMPYESNKYKIGDLYVKYNVKIPDNISMDIKNKIAELFNYPGIAKPSDKALEVSTVKFTESTNYDSDEDDDVNNQDPRYRQHAQHSGMQCQPF